MLAALGTSWAPRAPSEFPAKSTVAALSSFLAQLPSGGIMSLLSATMIQFVSCAAQQQLGGAVIYISHIVIMRLLLATMIQFVSYAAQQQLGGTVIYISNILM